jgi:hypothetical protein
MEEEAAPVVAQELMEEVTELISERLHECEVMYGSARSKEYRSEIANALIELIDDWCL